MRSALSLHSTGHKRSPHNSENRSQKGFATEQSPDSVRNLHEEDVEMPAFVTAAGLHIDGKNDISVEHTESVGSYQLRYEP